MVKIAVLGYGTIGSGVVEALDKNRDIVKKNAGQEISVKYVLDLRDFPGNPVEKILVHDFDIILKDPEVDIVIEVMGGVDVPYKFVRAALLAGKSVCTSNKALVAAHGPELIKIAADKNINFLFEASVGGGIPIIRPLLTSLTADDVYKITGILNGTTNYILTKMFDEGCGYEETLKEAQSLGYAEADPSADVDGWDAARKIAILASLASGKNVNFQDMPVKGIRDVSAEDMVYARALDKKIKLLATAFFKDGNIYCCVAPNMVGKESMLYSTDGVMNAISVSGNILGEALFYGAGAGKLPTASAVVADIIDEARHLHENIPIRWEDTAVSLEAVSQYKSRYFIRLDKKMESLKNSPDVEEIMSLPEYPDEFAIITKEVPVGTVEMKLNAADGVKSLYRMV